ncbi:MAG: hypothetical protein EXS16_14905 [Gemmataceae bacterium]|nr:hypothetical protein [Gemmataceae bacterium]
MGHIIRIRSREQYMAALNVLDYLPGTWHSRGAGEFPVLLVLDSHFQALVKAGVVQVNGNEGKARGQKATKKTQS